uniref:Mu-thomitoxin-Hme1b n=1 Tax=Heriaeus mellotteei TaxID=2337432 RepID=TXHM2_HERML|nr:RecName: Full=Mu-thomitoxin-Hme1b; Short=Mu-TMTX-Hme1b; AltName: Full=Neurotoxin Hm-2 [Heriaeus mellotteei]
GCIPSFGECAWFSGESCCTGICKWVFFTSKFMCRRVWGKD